MKPSSALAAAVALLFVSWARLTGAEKIDFALDVKPLLEGACLTCHGSEKPKGDLRLDSKAGALKGGEHGTALVPGQPKESRLYASTILPPDDENIMPPKGGPLTKEQSEVLRLWIEQGAEWPEGLTLTKARRIDFVKDIQPILEFNCVACHREGHAKNELRLETRSDAFKGGEHGPAIVPRRPDKSPLYTSTTLPADHDDLMPPANKGGPLPKDSTVLLASWISQGSPWPDGVTLKQKKHDQKPGGDELALVRDIHTRILAEQRESAEADMKAYTNFIPGTTVTFAMVPIPSGQFLMGSPAGEMGRKPDEGPQHQVKIAPFWMGQYEVTWNEFELFMYPDLEKDRTTGLTNVYINKTSDAVSRPTKPYVEMSFGMGKEGYPAISMTHHSANKYCEWLSAKTGQYYRLPTEAEWEYACRAGTTTAYFWGDDPKVMSQYAWWGKNSDWKYQRVGKKKPNPWGLYDIAGNVIEWCLDQYSPETYAKAGDAADNPWVKSTTPYPHVARGGHWDDEDPAFLRSAFRRHSEPKWKQQDPQLPKSIWYHTDAQFLGIRLVRPLKVPPPEELRKIWNNGVELD